MTTPAQRIDADLQKRDFPPHACGNLEELRGWLQSANAEWLAGQQTAEADHRRLIEQVQAAIEEAQGK